MPSMGEAELVGVVGEGALTCPRPNRVLGESESG